MSSTLRYYNQIKPLTKLETLSTPSYSDSTIFGGTVVPIPFSYHNGVLDINIQDAVQGELIGTGGQPLQSSKGTYKAKEMGGTGKVFSLGPNMLAWLKNIVELDPANFYGPGPGQATFLSAEVQEGGYVTKAQLTLDGSSLIGNFAEITTNFAISSDKPIGDQYVYGAAANNYFTTWIFKSPVVIKIRKSGGNPAAPNITYMSFYSNWTLAP